MKLYEHVGVKTVFAEQEADCYEQGEAEMQFHHYRYEIFIVNVSHIYNAMFILNANTLRFIFVVSCTQKHYA